MRAGKTELALHRVQEIRRKDAPHRGFVFCSPGRRVCRRLPQEAYPSNAITLVVPYAPGGGSDFLGRILADGIKARLKETVVVQNIPGAGSAVGSMQVAKAKPDGYTLLLNHIGLSTMPTLYKKLNFDPLASFEFIGLYAEAPMLIMARKDFAPKTFAELVAYAKANKEKFTMASAGMGSATHLCAMLFQEAIGVPFTIVAVQGRGPAVIDVRAGQVDAICDLPTTTSGMIRSRRTARLRADRPAAHGYPARRADLDRARHAEPRYRRLVRPLCAARHAQADPR